MRNNSFNKTAVSCKDNLGPGPEARAGLRQGVPGEGPHLPSPSTLSSHICSVNLHLQRWRGGSAEVPGDELVEVGGQNGSLSSC